ncbi:MAG: cell division protein ZapA [Prolixibacteraceae bacterium]|nr:cell division protein ZapA [Prolixibacteraceae bacterium]
MKEKLSIKLNIGGRTYPITIDREQEEKYRKVAKRINDIISEYSKKYAKLDVQDFMAMTTFQVVFENMEKAEMEDESPVLEELKSMDEELSDFLNE